MSITSSEISSPAIEVVGLRKSFGHQLALDGLDLRVESGQTAGFFGPNGSGKLTTIRILLGLLRAEATTVRVLGRDPWRDAVELHRRIAYVPGDVNLWPNLIGGQIIDILGGLRGGVNKARRDEILQRFELDPSKKAWAYSKGNRQKVALDSALASDAELLILDEPTSGLDPIWRPRSVPASGTSRPRDVPCCSPATSSPRLKTCVTPSPSFGRARQSNPER